MEYLLKTYKELKNKKNRKGFTLVELLVVIAILAVLASVSVVGYLGFTTKARNSNALTELSQAKEVIRAELIEGTKTYSISSSDGIKKTPTENAESNDSATYYIAFTYSNTSGKNKLSYNVYSDKDNKTAATGVTITWDKVFKKCFDDLNSLGTFKVLENSKTISAISYTTKNNGGEAYWVVEDDKVSNDNSSNSSFTEETALS